MLRVENFEVIEGNGEALFSRVDFGHCQLGSFAIQATAMLMQAFIGTCHVNIQCTYT